MIVSHVPAVASALVMVTKRHTCCERDVICYVIYISFLNVHVCLYLIYQGKTLRVRHPEKKALETHRNKGNDLAQNKANACAKHLALYINIRTASTHTNKTY